MVSKNKIKELLEITLKTGADFSEIYFEDTRKTNVSFLSGKVDEVGQSLIYGVSIRAIKDNIESFAYTSDLNYKNLVNVAQTVASAFTGEQKITNVELKKIRYKLITNPIKNSIDVTIKDKVAIVNKLYDSVKDYSKQLVQIVINLSDSMKFITIANSTGLFATKVDPVTRLVISCVASDGNSTETVTQTYGKAAGYEIFDGFDYEKFSHKTAKDACMMLGAEDIKGGEMTVVLNSGFGGVIFHEACGHLLEATSVATGSSIFAKKIGEVIANKIVSAVDNGTIKDEWGSISIDDEGHKSQNNILIKNGVLKSFLVDYRNSKIMNHPTTGSARKQSYKFSPTSRMTNTYILPGKSTFEEIIANTQYGFYAASMGGGSVDPATGEFNFGVQVGYLIENGKITKPIKGATLISTGAKVLMNIDMIGNEVTLATGMCGSQSGAVPTTVGQPVIRVLNITVGGKGV